MATDFILVLVDVLNLGDPTWMLKPVYFVVSTVWANQG